MEKLHVDNPTPRQQVLIALFDIIQQCGVILVQSQSTETVSACEAIINGVLEAQRIINTVEFEVKQNENHNHQ